VNLLVVAALIVASVAVTVSLVFVARRVAPEGMFLRDPTRGTAIFGTIGTGFAVLLAFVVLVAFQSYGRAKAGAESEAVAVVELFRTAEFFPAAERDELQAAALCYARAAVSEWQPMRDGERSAAVDTWVARLQEAAGRLRLRNAIERSAFAHILELRDDRAAGRRERLSEADPVITAPIWLILGLGGIVAVLLVLIFSDRREHFLVQASLMAAFTTVVASGLILVWSLDDPYRDTTGSIRPVEMQRSIAIMQEHRPSLVLPCTAGGDPRPS
jgi:hypothetical protein